MLPSRPLGHNTARKRGQPMAKPKEAHFIAGFRNVKAAISMATKISDLRTQQGIDKHLSLIQDFVAIDWNVRSWTKHRLLAARREYGRAPPTAWHLT
jgi:hypothetical protein